MQSLKAPTSAIFNPKSHHKTTNILGQHGDTTCVYVYKKSSIFQKIQCKQAIVIKIFKNVLFNLKAL